MIIRFVVALTMALWSGAAYAQLGTLYGGPPAPVAQPARPGLETLPAEQSACLDGALRDEGYPGVQNFIARHITTADPTVERMLKRCAFLREKSIGADETTLTFVRWFATDLLAKPQFLKAFIQCKSIISNYQGRLLEGLKSQVAASESRSGQQQLSDVISGLSAGQRAAADVACLKLFIANIKVSGSGSGYFSGELSRFDVNLSGGFDFTRRAQARLSDLTDEGMASLLSASSFTNIPSTELKVEIDSAPQRPISGYLACFVTNEWVPRLSSLSDCHRPLMERSLLKAVAAITLPER